MNDIYGGGQPPRIGMPIDPPSVGNNAEQRREALDREDQFRPHVSRWSRFVARFTRS